MSRKKVSDAVARPVRTAGQGGISYALVETLEAFNVIHLTARQYGAVVLLGTIVVGYIQTLGENRGWWKPVLRTVPPKKDPVVGDLVEQPDDGEPKRVKAENIPRRAVAPKKTTSSGQKRTRGKKTTE